MLKALGPARGLVALRRHCLASTHHLATSQPHSPTPRLHRRLAAPLTTMEAGKGDAEAMAAGAEARQQDTVLQYIVIRKDLWTKMGWPLGSFVTQACHAATAALWLSRESPVTLAYCAPDNLDSMHKVVLEVKGEAQLRTLAEKLAAAGVAHKLWIEQPEGYATCLALAPLPKSEAQPFVKKLKLCSGTHPAPPPGGELESGVAALSVNPPE